MDTFLSNELKKLKAKLDINPYQLALHNNVINALRNFKRESYEELNNARMQKLEVYMFSGTEIQEWIEDLQMVPANSSKRFEVITTSFEAILRDYPTSHLWQRYIRFIIEEKLATENEIDDSHINNLFRRALLDVSNDFMYSNDVWNLIIDYYLGKFEASGSEDENKILLNIYMKRLNYPHYKLDESFSEFTSFVSKFNQEHYESLVQEANRIYQKTLKAQRYYETYELKLLEDTTSIVTWCSYLKQVHQYSGGDVKKINTLFYRSLTCNFLFQPWDVLRIPIWLEFLYCIYEEPLETQTEILSEVLGKFIRAYPENPISYTEYVRNIQILLDSLYLFSQIRQRVNLQNIRSHCSYESWSELAIAILGNLYLLVKDGNNVDLVSDLYNEIEDFLNFAFKNKDNINNSIERLSLKIYMLLDDREQAQTLINSLLKAYPHKYEILKLAIDFEAWNNDNKDTKILYSEAIASAAKFDKPMQLLNDCIMFEQITGDLKALRNATQSYLQMKQQLEERQMKKRAVTPNLNEEASKVVERRPVKRVKLDKKRNREELTAKVSNIPSKYNEGMLALFFNDCGQPRNIQLRQKDDDTKIALIEWNDEQELLSSLTKSFKKVDGNEILVERLVGNTIWICNFPPCMDKEELRQLFSETGSVISIRLPSLKSNHKRRFCYVEYEDSKNAVNAVHRFDGKTLNDQITNREYKLVVRISSPEEKSARSDAKEPQSQVFLSNLDFRGVTKDLLWEKFCPFGNIDNIYIPLNDKMKKKGNQNNGYAFIQFKDGKSAEKALTMDGCFICNRRVSVSPAKRQETRQYELQDFDDLKTVCLENLGDKVRKEELEKYILKQVGTCLKVQLYPEFEAALVEFKDASSAGIAALKLKDQNLDNQPIIVGPKSDLAYKLKGKNPNERKQKLMVPASVQLKGNIKNE